MIDVYKRQGHRHIAQERRFGTVEDEAHGELVDLFHLRPGVKFHTTDYFKPTRSLNADDVLWTFQRALDPKHPWHASALRGYAYFDAMGMGELIKSVEKVDELTVRFVLNLSLIHI